MDLALALLYAHHTIESERLLTKLMQICRRVHGYDHSVTEHTLTALEYVKTRLINIGMGTDLYQALRYENGGQKIVMKGLIIDDKKRDEEKLLNTNSKDAVPLTWTPVVVHSLRCDIHFNGKIGDIRAYSEDNRICEIHFEEEGLEPAVVELENVRILFDSPEKE
eukprot:scaffold390_cov149-Skeletonema_menzelii.AAC.11